MNYLFVYGLLKSESVQNALFGKSLKTTKAKLFDYALYEAEDGFYFIMPAKEEVVKGYIVEISDQDLKISDAFEWCPEVYQRMIVKVEYNQQEIDCFIYNRVDDVGKHKKINDFSQFSRLSEEEIMLTEIERFKTEEHPEFYNK